MDGRGVLKSTFTMLSVLGERMKASDPRRSPCRERETTAEGGRPWEAPESWETGGPAACAWAHRAWGWRRVSPARDCEVCARAHPWPAGIQAQTSVSPAPAGATALVQDRTVQRRQNLLEGTWGVWEGTVLLADCGGGVALTHWGLQPTGLRP